MVSRTTIPVSWNKELSSQSTIKVSILLSLGALIAIVNLVEVIMIAKIKRKKKIYEILLLSLSVSDLMFGILNVFVCSFYLVYGFKNQNLINTTYTFYFFFILSSVFHLLFITIDRLVIVLKPLKHRTFWTMKKLYAVLFLIWILAVLLSALMQVLNECTELFKQRETKVQSRYSNIPHKPSKMVSLATQNKSNYPQGLQMILSVTIVMADFIIFSSYIHDECQQEEGFKDPKVI